MRPGFAILKAMVIQLFSALSISFLSTLSLTAKTNKIIEDSAELYSIPIVYSPNYKISLFGLEKLHPFDIGKYDKIYNKLRTEGIVGEKTTYTPVPFTEEQLLLIHSRSYLESLKNAKMVANYLEAPVLGRVPRGVLKTNVVDRFILASGGTLKAAHLALEKGYAINLGGGYHHAKPNKGEGFCIIADVPIAIRQLQNDKKIKKALIIDTDVHQGNGTIACLKNDETTFTFSMHQKHIYPIPKEQGDLDVELPAGMNDQEYLKVLARKLPKLFTAFKPDIVFHVAGCDALRGDPLASLNMTHAGIEKRDLMVAMACHKFNVPYVMTLSGGYSKNAWNAQYRGIKAIAKWARNNPFK